jgi:hypothetical protein
MAKLYSAILGESDQYECRPLFLREDDDQITSHPVRAVEIAKWMITAARVATGNRRRVLEDGPDVMNSDDEDSKKEEHGEELHGMYAQGCASLEQTRLTEQQAQAQRAAGYMKDTPGLDTLLSDSSRISTPLPSSANSDDEDWSWMTEGQRKLAEVAKAKLAENPVKALPPPRPATRIPDPEVQAPAKGAEVKVTRTKSKAAAPSRAPADQPTEAKASTRTKGQAKGQAKGQESPETKVSTPIQTRGAVKRKASGAGNLRSGGGSGQTETGVLQMATPSKT